MQPPESITQLLVNWSHGDQKALDKLMPLVYSELRRLAGNYLRRERPGHTLQPTALVNEAYLKLVDQKNAKWQNRAQFFALRDQHRPDVFHNSVAAPALKPAMHGAVVAQLFGQSVPLAARAQAVEDAVQNLPPIDPRPTGRPGRGVLQEHGLDPFP